MAAPAQAAYRFNGFRVDPGRRLLFGADGRSIPLKPKVFDVLLYLVERPGELVAKQALLDAVWPHVVVEENNLNKAISTLRQVFGEARDEHRFIVTEPGRGYRFVASVEGAHEAAPPSEAKTPTLPIDALGDRAGQPHDVEAARTQGQRLNPKRSARPLIYLGLGAVLLAVTFIAVNNYLRGPPTREVVTASGQFRIDAPAGSTFGLAPVEPLPALSPDGTQLAFVAPLEARLVGVDPKLVVWVQRVGSPEARPLAGTEHAVNQAAWPSWSPDGRFIAFGADGRLKRVEVAGRTEPRELAVIDSVYFGGTWTTGGTIVFAVRNSGLHRIPADGGTAEPLTHIDTTRGELSHRFPVMLPDGRRFVYLILSEQRAYTGLYLGSVDDRDMKVRLLPDDSRAVFGRGPDGRLHLLFVRDGLLLTLPFDAARGALIGDPIRIAAEPIVVATSMRSAAFTASGRVLVYRPRFAPSSELVWIDRGGIRGPIVGPECRLWRFPALSPDGKKLSAACDDGGERAGLWWFDLDRGGVGELLAPKDLPREQNPMQSAWTPDSMHVVYTYARPGGWIIYRRSLTGVDAVPLLDGSIPGSTVGRVRDVTADLVLFQDSLFQSWVLPFAGDGQPRRVPIEQGPGTHARISPDGRWLAFTVANGEVTDVWVTTFPEPTQRWRVSTAGGADPQWSSDGSELYYVASDRTLMVVNVEAGDTPRFSTPEQLFRAWFDRFSLLFGSAYAPRPDGEGFIVLETTGDEVPRLIVDLNWGEQR